MNQDNKEFKQNNKKKKHSGSSEDSMANWSPLYYQDCQGQ